VWGQPFGAAAALLGGVLSELALIWGIRAHGNALGVYVVERDAAQKGGGSPKGLTPHCVPI